MSLALVLPALLPAGMSAAEEGTGPDTGPTDPPVVSSQAGDAAAVQGSVRVLVTLDEDVTAERALSPQGVDRQRARIAAAQRRVEVAVPDHAARVERRFATAAGMAMTVTPEGLALLEARPDVSSVTPDPVLEPALATTVPYVEATNLHEDENVTGDGQAIAVLDTGVDAGHPAFGGRVIAEACFSQGDCPDDTNEQIGPGAGAPLAIGDGVVGHGTHVAGIAAGQEAVGSSLDLADGVAPWAGIVSVQVFHEDGGEARTSLSDVIRGLEHVYELARDDRIDVAAANLSLGTSATYSAPCAESTFDKVVDNLAAEQVAVIAAAGNGGQVDAISMPACLEGVVSVGALQVPGDLTGATETAIADYSNLADFVDLVAPGTSWSAYPDGGAAGLEGTSMAAPHVAGSWALLQPEADSVDEVLGALTATAVDVVDGRDDASDTPHADMRLSAAFGELADPLNLDGATDVTEIEEGNADQVVYTVTASDGAGEPLDGVTITFSHDGGGGFDTDSVTTDADGQAQATYTAENDTGTVTLQASADGVTHEVTIDVTAPTQESSPSPAPGPAPEPVLEPDGTLSGSVVDAEGETPLADVVISADDEPVTTSDDEGRFSATLPAGTWTVTASVEGYAPASTDVEILADESTVADLTLTATAVEVIAGERFAGDDRYGTAAALSAQTFEPGVERVYVATGLEFADALPGGVAAAVHGAPLLLVTGDAVPEATARELDRLDPDRIIVLGGDKAANATVASSLEPFASEGVERLYGADRYETAVQVSQATFASADTVYVSTGTDFPDGLAGAPAAAHDEAPLLLTAERTLPEATAAELERLAPDRIVVLGGLAVIDEAVADDLAEYGRVVRLAGKDRFATAALVAERLPDPEEVYVATGFAFADALSAAAVAGAHGAPVLLTSTDQVPGATLDALERIAPTRLHVMGGDAAVTQPTEDDLRGALLP